MAASCAQAFTHLFIQGTGEALPLLVLPSPGQAPESPGPFPELLKGAGGGWGGGGGTVHLSFEMAHSQIWNLLRYVRISLMRGGLHTQGDHLPQIPEPPLHADSLLCSPLLNELQGLSRQHLCGKMGRGGESEGGGEGCA